MSTMLTYLSLIVCIVGGGLFAICHEREKVPPFIAKLALVAFGAGLLAFLLK